MGSETVDENEKSMMEMLPDLPLANILRCLDGKSALNLQRVSKTISESVNRNLSGIPGAEYWVRECSNWQLEPALLAVLASYDGVLEWDRRQVFHINAESVGFTWSTVFCKAHDVASVLRHNKFQLVPLKLLENQIKADIRTEFRLEEFSYAFPKRLTGSSGSIGFNILCSEDGRGSLVVYENFDRCLRVLEIPGGPVHYGLLMILPADVAKPSTTESHCPRLCRVLITVSKTSVVLSPLQVGVPLTLDINPCSPNNNYHMDPVIAINRNLLAVWSSPFSLRVHIIHSGQHGTIMESDPPMEFAYDSLETKRFMNTLWRRMLDNSTEFILSLEITTDRSCQDQDQSVKIVVTFPLKEEVATLSLGHSESSERQLIVGTEKLQCFPSNPSSHLSEDVDVATISSQDLKICWTSDILAVSREYQKWYYRNWAGLLPTYDSGDVTLVQIIGSDLLGIICSGKLLVVIVSLDEEIKSEASENPLTLPWITIELIRIIDFGFPIAGKELRQFRLDFEYGSPYLWLEVDRVLCPETPECRPWKNSPLSFELYKLTFRD